MCRRYINFVDLLMVQMFLHWNLPFENIVLIFFDYFDQSIVWWLASKGSNISTSHYLRKHWLILLNATLQNMYGMLGRNINFWVLHPSVVNIYIDLQSTMSDESINVYTKPNKRTNVLIAVNERHLPVKYNTFWTFLWKHDLHRLYLMNFMLYWSLNPPYAYNSK